jgi:hypothetical protein
MDHIAFYNGKDTSIMLTTSTQAHNVPNIVTLEYSESFQKMPIYGYKSVLADEFLLGEKLIQGQFSINTADHSSLLPIMDVFREGLDDTKFTPDLADEHLISQNTVNIQIFYENIDFHRQPKTVASYGLGSKVYEKTGPYYIKEKNIMRTIEDVTILGMQTGFSSTADPILEFYNFIAKRVT